MFSRNMIFQHNVICNHQPYSPDLAPSVYHMLMHLMKWLASPQFEIDDELQTNMNEWGEIDGRFLRHWEKDHGITMLNRC